MCSDCVGDAYARTSPPSFNWVDGFIGTQIHLTPKFCFSSDFGHLILKMLENATNVSTVTQVSVHLTLAPAGGVDFNPP